MLGRTEPAHNETKNIRLVVDDEQSLYTPLSPEDEFNDAVKSYIRAKITAGGLKRYTGITVVSRKPIDEDKFRTAISNWVRDEKEGFKREGIETVRLLIGMLIFGSVLVVSNIKLQQKFEVARYSLVPIMGSLSLSRAVGILIVDMPVFLSKIQALNRIEKGSVVAFEYHPDAEEAT